MATAAKALDELGRCVVALLLKEPFYAHLLGGLTRKADPSFATAAVVLRPGHIELVVNPTFFLETLRLREERIAVLKHEVLHVVFRHLFRLQRDFHDPQLFNIAADLVVNQYVKPFKLPEGAILLSTFPALSLPEEQTVEWYYDRLRQEQQKNGGQGLLDLGQGQGPGQDPGRGHGASHCDHSGWAIHGADGGGAAAGAGNQQAPLSPALIDALEGAADAWVQRAVERTGAPGIGSLPGGVRTALDAWAARRKPKVDWKRTLRLFAQSSRRTRVTVSQRRESKRFESIPGLKRYPGLKIKRYQRLVVAVDTSGSVTEASLTAFFAEVHGLWKQGAEITVVECDAAIGEVYEYRGRPPRTVSGGGGTAFEPVFAWLREQRQPVDGLIYLTDGYAEAPTTRPRCRVLWVLEPGGSKDACTPGRVVELPSV